MTYQCHLIIPASVSLSLHLFEVMRLGQYNNTITTAELSTAGDENRAQYTACEVH